MKKVILVLAVLVSSNSFASGLFTKVDTYTLQGLQGIKNDNTSNSIPVPFTVEGFATSTDCQNAGDALKTQAFIKLSNSYGATVAYSNYTCHKVKVVIPVLDVVLPTPTPAP